MICKLLLVDPACSIRLSRRKVLFSGLKFINMTPLDNDSRENSKICTPPPAPRPNLKEVVTGPCALKTAPRALLYLWTLARLAATRSRISNKPSADSRISQSNYRNLTDRRQKMLSLRDPYFRSLDFSNIYFFEFFPWNHNSLAFNITHHNRWKSEMRAVSKVVFAFGLVTATFSFSNNWHKHISHLKLAEKSKWPYN